MTPDINVPISPGELIDKITILQIKSERMSDAAKVANVRVELDLLESTWQRLPARQGGHRAEWSALKQINEKLWDRRRRYSRQGTRPGIRSGVH